uniref:Secreted protein n=1 Tax=Arundo donax TaxID=35708 RepID=A0A0A9CAN0_ARUDO
MFQEMMLLCVIDLAGIVYVRTKRPGTRIQSISRCVFRAMWSYHTVFSSELEQNKMLHTMQLKLKGNA